MSTSIISRTISSVVDKRIVLSNSAIARTLSVGTTWTTLRVGVRWSMTDFGGTIPGTPAFHIGFCKGTTNIPGDATCDHFVGVRNTGANVARGAGPPPSYGFTFMSCKLVGSTYTDGSSVAKVIQADPASGFRSMLFVTITKGSPNFSFNLFGPGSSPAADLSLDNFLAQMEISAPSFTGYAATPLTAVAVSEVTNGFLDSLCVYWGRTTPVIEHSDIAVARIA